MNNYPGAQSCKSYLDSRLKPESQKLFGFGYFPGVQDMPVLADLVGNDTLSEAKLIYTREIEDSLFPRKILTCYFESQPLVMPWRNTYGDVVGLVGRTILNEEDRIKQGVEKYKNTAKSPLFEKGHMLFGLYENKQHILDKGCVYIVEGQFDVIKASEIGFRNIIALGNSSMTSYQFSVISRYSNSIFLLLDNDVAGQKGRKQIISKFGHMANIRNFYLPEDYKDIDECVTKGKFSGFAEIPFMVKD